MAVRTLHAGTMRMNVQFIPLAGLVDTLTNASGVVESWDFEQYDRVYSARRPNGVRHIECAPLSQKQSIEKLASYYADWANKDWTEKDSIEWAKEHDDDLGPFDSIAYAVLSELGIDCEPLDYLPANLNLFKAKFNLDESGDDLGDNV